MHSDRRQNPPPLSEEQLTFFADLQKESTHRSLRRWGRGAVIGYAILIAGVFAMYENGQSVSEQERQAVVKSGTVVAVEGCNRDFRAGKRFIKLLTRLKMSSDAQYASKRITAQQHDAAIEFYAGEIGLAKSKLPDCRHAESILTDDPDADLNHTKPLYRKP